MTLADLKAEALAQVDQLRRERDEARRRAADLTKILIREGGVEGAYERQLAQAFNERDEARAEVERLKADNAKMGDYWSFAAALRDVAERQREACVAMLARLSPDIPYIQVVRNTPLVTEGDK